VGIITQNLYDTASDLPRGLRIGVTSEENNVPGLLKRTASDMRPQEEDPIRALVLTGDDLEELTTADWDIILTKYTEIVFSRTNPEQKMLIVEETKRRGDNIVAVVSVYISI
jgi:sodium/potassium-transporting ATPase subunit alpha